MRLDIRKIVALAALLLLAATAVPSMAYNYSVGSGWEKFTCWADVEAPVPGPTYGWYGGTTPDGNSPFNEPFEFTLYSVGYLRVADVFEGGDYFNVFNYGALLGTTPQTPWAFGPITNDPDVAFGNPALSSATFQLNPGTYSLQFQDVFFKDGITSVPQGPDLISDAYFRVDPVPEPASLVLLGLGLGVTGLIARRRQRA